MAVNFRLEDKNYVLQVDSSRIEIFNQGVSAASYETHNGGDCYGDGPYHTIGNIFYFVTQAIKYQSKRVYSFNPQVGRIEAVLSPVLDPHFVKTRLVEFGTNCNNGPGPYKGDHAVISIYDLNRPKGDRKVGVHILMGPFTNWYCRIQGDQVIASDGKQGTQTIPIFLDNFSR